MLKKLRKQLKNEKGLTLIELLAVIVILAVIAAIAVPAIGNIINNSKDKALLSEASNILAGAKIAMVDGACKTTNTDVAAGVTGAKAEDFCAKAELTEFVEGVTSSGDYSAYKNGDDWYVNYAELANIVDKKDKYDANVKKAVGVKETDLNSALQQ